MTEVIREGGFTVHILLPPREHGPAHVHIRRAGAEVVIRLGSPAQPARVWEVYGMKDSEVVRAMHLVQRHLAQLRGAWERIHGDSEETR